MAGMATNTPFAPSTLMASSQFEHRTCGMQTALVQLVRQAKTQSSNDSMSALLEDVAQAAMAKLDNGANVVAVFGPPMGPPKAVFPALSDEEEAAAVRPMPQVIIWLLLDPIDIDCKQTTFVNRSCINAQKVFENMYKLQIQ